MKRITVLWGFGSELMSSLSRIAVTAVSIIGMSIYSNAQCVIPVGNTQNISTLDWSGCNSTIVVNGILVVDGVADLRAAGTWDNQVTLIIDGPNAQLNFLGSGPSILHMDAGSQIILGNGGTITEDDGTGCSASERIYIGWTGDININGFPTPGSYQAYASCAGLGISEYLFSELNGFAAGITINAIAPAIHCFGTDLALNATGSVVNGPATFSWTGSGPAGFTFDATSANPTILASEITVLGSYTFTARITDAFGFYQEQTVSVEVVTGGACPEAPINDLPCGALSIRTNNSPNATSLNTYGFISDVMSCDNANGDNTFATPDALGTACNGSFGRSMWYTFTTPMCDLNGAVPFEIELSTNNFGTDFNTKVYLFSSPTNSCTDLVQVACNDDHNGAGYPALCGDADATSSTIVASSLLPNTQYWVKVDGLNSTDFGNFVLSGRALAPAHGAASISGGTQIQLTTSDMGAALYTYLYKQVGSTGYSIKNSQTALSDVRTLATGNDYLTQVMYRCDGDFFNQSQWYATEAQIVSLELSCAVVSDMTCTFNGPNSYTLTWTQPAGILFTNNGQLTGYRIKRNPIGSTGVFTFSNPAVVCVDGTCSVTLPGNSPTGFNWTIETRCSSVTFQVGNTTDCGPASEMTLGNDANNNTDKSMQHTFSFVNAEAGIEFYDVQMFDAYADFGLNTPMIGDYEMFVNANNEINWRRVETTSNTNFDFVIVPNPSNAMTTVHLSTIIDAGSFTIVDAMGRTINSGAINNTDIISIDAAQLQSGVYLVVVTIGNQKMTRRLVVAD
jgi:hypothetical protein